MKICDKCGLNNNHTKSECKRQQNINKENLSKDPKCRWCGVSTLHGGGNHREGCPLLKKDISSFTEKGNISVYRNECGYCGAVSEYISQSSSKSGHGGASYRVMDHKIGCPKFVYMTNKAS